MEIIANSQLALGTALLLTLLFVIYGRICIGIRDRREQGEDIQLFGKTDDTDDEEKE